MCKNHTLDDFSCCLKDIGCDQQMIAEFLKDEHRCDVDKQLSILEKQRRITLDQLHDNQKKIDCIDYLIYQLKKIKEAGDVL